VALDIGTILLQKNLISQDQFREAREMQMQRGGEMGRICVDMGYVDERRLASAISQVMGIPKVDLGRVTADMEAIAKIPRRLAVNLCAFPCVRRENGHTLWVAMANPMDADAKEAVRRAAGCPIKVTVAGYREIEAAIAANYGPEDDDEFSVDGGTEGEVKITDMAGNTLVTMAPQAPPEKAPPPAPPTAPEPQEPSGYSPLTEDEKRLVQMLQEGRAKSTAALMAVLGLCVEKKLFTREQLAMKLGRR
jgi:hypothetical protein